MIPLTNQRLVLAVLFILTPGKIYSHLYSLWRVLGESLAFSFLAIIISSAWSLVLVLGSKSVIILWCRCDLLSSEIACDLRQKEKGWRRRLPFLSREWVSFSFNQPGLHILCESILHSSCTCESCDTVTWSNIRRFTRGEECSVQKCEFKNITNPIQIFVLT